MNQLKNVLRKVPGLTRAVRTVRARTDFTSKLMMKPPQPTPPFTVTSQRPRDEIAKDIANRNWFHTFELDNGLVARASDPSHMKSGYMHIPDRLDGQTVLDIGAFDGHFSFEAARRGAADVLATDHLVWTHPDLDPLGNFNLIRELTGLPVRDQLIKVEDLSNESIGGPFDIVFFFGVLYHAADPLGYLKIVRSITRKFALIETVVDMLDVDRPALAYYPGTYLNNDGSNHFGPNMPALIGMLGDAGFSKVDDLGLWRGHELERVQGRSLPGGPAKTGRAVVRAWV